jgi:hypothetical protein
MIVALMFSCEQNSIVPTKENDFITIDTVYLFNPGTGQNAGQSSEYFPKNIFGEPSTNATMDYPENAQSRVLSLGLDGSIVIGFKNYKIVDGDGDDFIIFENAFRNPVNSKIFVEPAKVAVSNDGINFIEFPFDSLSLIGCAGITPTYWNPQKILDAGGDKFDLSKLGLSSITHIKITDISNMILQNPNHPFYDQIISGFDLDAVIGINYEKMK